MTSGVAEPEGCCELASDSRLSPTEHPVERGARRDLRNMGSFGAGDQR